MIQWQTAYAQSSSYVHWPEVENNSEGNKELYLKKAGKSKFQNETIFLNIKKKKNLLNNMKRLRSQVPLLIKKKKTWCLYKLKLQCKYLQKTESFIKNLVKL